ncbi:MAG: tetratricopeptide repeat protein [Sandaracinus sp.]|nr:tetratricopeptide repeat protein [Myxococcales bacterium]MCB9603421.1 tetratricopeptide repeat protein [Sandaracinus sp.]MCB9612214.1 tetratricopeptide repeat protein [Sandaracinus sp.]MCB9618362.1 tetratricopeptide repeat protein [Sandaracinus sp.]
MRPISFSLCLLVLASTASAQNPSELEALSRSARQSPRDADAQRAWGRALARAGRWREAERALTQAARLRDGSLEALYEVASVTFAEGDYRRARNACRTLERKEAGAALTHVCRARAFLVWNRSGRAFEELEASTAAGGESLFEHWLALGDANRLRFEVAPSEAAYRRAIALDAARFEPHLGLALLFANAGRESDARAQLDEAHRKDSNVPEVWYELGRRTPGAEGHALLTRAIAVRPRWGAALVALAEHELAAGDRANARTHFQAAIGQDARNADAHVGLGRVLATEGDDDGAEAAYLRALEIVPNLSAAQVALGELDEARGLTQDAYEHYSTAANLNPRDPTGLLKAATLAVSQQRDVLATGFLDRLMRVHPNLAAGHALYGDALRLRGDRAGAAERYQRALRGEGDVDRARVEQALTEVRREPVRGPQRHRAGGN